MGYQVFIGHFVLAETPGNRDSGDDVPK